MALSVVSEEVVSLTWNEGRSTLVFVSGRLF